MDGTTDLLLVAAPFYHVQGEEGRVYVYRVNEQVGQSPSSRAGRGCGCSAWGRGGRGWERPGPALQQRAEMGSSGGTAAWWGGCSLRPLPPFLTFPTPSSHVEDDGIANGCTVTKHILSVISLVSHSNCGRQLLLPFYR